MLPLPPFLVRMILCPTQAVMIARERSRGPSSERRLRRRCPKSTLELSLEQCVIKRRIGMPWVM